MFCERCGSLQPKPEASTARSAGVLARRVLDAVGITESQARPGEDWLRLCLNCRGYSCPACWNPADGVCQTCAPLPEPVQVVSPEPVHVTVTEPNPAPVAAEPEPVAAEPEPVAVAEQIAEPEPVAVEPEPVVLEPEPAVVEPEPAPATRPGPRMPVLPLPPPRPANAPILPLPTLPAYPVAPQIAFSDKLSAAASIAAAEPAYQQHSLLAAPLDTSHGTSAGLRPCRNCELSLSARARFCRRCGTAQST